MLVPLVRDRGADRARARELELAILEREIAVLAAGIDAATWRLLERIREFDEKQGWSGGWQSCAHWLNWRVGIGIIAAREKVRVAHALKELPEVSEAFRTGILSYSKVRAITRVATPALEHELVAMARWATAHHVEKIVRMYRKAKRCEENRRAGALGLVAESALAGGLAKRAGTDRATITVHIDRAVRLGRAASLRGRRAEQGGLTPRKQGRPRGSGPRRRPPGGLARPRDGTAGSRDRRFS